MSKKDDKKDVEIFQDEAHDKKIEQKIPEIVSEAPEGFRELRPGKSLVCHRTYSAAKFHLIDEKWVREKKKNRFVPDSVVMSLKLTDKQIKETFI